MMRKKRRLATVVLVGFDDIKQLVQRDIRLQVVKLWYIFYEIKDLHLSTGHAGRDKMFSDG